MKKNRNSEEAVIVFEKCSLICGLATENGDYKTNNKNFIKMMRCIKYLYEQKQLFLLKPLLNHENPAVRSDCAFALLPFETQVCESVLSEVANGKYGIHSSNAYYTLREWKRGKLIFPWQSEWNW